MFDGKKLITKGIKQRIPPYLHYLLWMLIDFMEVKEKDYLQVFELREEVQDGNLMQKIIHIQERPRYKSEHIFKASEIVTAKIYIIDDGTHCTMLLADEY